MLMNRAVAIYCGIVATVLFSGIGLVFVPDRQISALQPYTDDSGETYPIALFGAAAQGREVYIDLGCVYCHSQQVRRKGFGGDWDRGWGERQTVARDYIYDSPHLLGTMRTGPDLANVGVRLPSAVWHFQHLYDPRSVIPGSIMPSFPFLFEQHTLKEGDQPPKEAVTLPEGWLKPNEYLVPTERAQNLVAYLLLLKHQSPLPEAP